MVITLTKASSIVNEGIYVDSHEFYALKFKVTKIKDHKREKFNFEYKKLIKVFNTLQQYSEWGLGVILG